MTTPTPSASVRLTTLPSSASSQTNQAVGVSAGVHAAAPARPPTLSRFSLKQSTRNRLAKIRTFIQSAVAAVTSIIMLYWAGKSWVLSKWTAKKDYLEFCNGKQQTNEALSKECPLEKPPILRRLLPLWHTAEQGKAKTQDQSNKALLFIVLAIILLAVSVVAKRYWCQVLRLAKYRSPEPCKRHRCLTFEHDSHPSILEASCSTIDLSASQLPGSPAAIITNAPNGNLRQRVAYRFQDSLGTFRFKAKSAGNKEIYEFTGVLDADAVYSLISQSAARKYGQPLETTEFYFAPNKAPELSYVGQSILPSTHILRLRICALDGSNNHKEMEMFVVDEQLETDCILAPEFQTTRFCY
jgi:hypothetical protein